MAIHKVAGADWAMAIHRTMFWIFAKQTLEDKVMNQFLMKKKTLRSKLTYDSETHNYIIKNTVKLNSSNGCANSRSWHLVSKPLGHVCTLTWGPKGRRLTLLGCGILWTHKDLCYPCFDQCWIDWLSTSNAKMTPGTWLVTSLTRLLKMCSDSVSVD